MISEFYNNEERDRYLKSRGKIVLSACPGSGKTTVVAYKLKQLINEIELSFGNHSGVVCLSFTNTAKDEILQTFRDFNGYSVPAPSKVLTINNFINTYVTLPFYRTIYKPAGRPQILEEKDFNELIKKYIYRSNFRLKNNKPIYFIYPPKNFRFDLSGNLVLKSTPTFESESDVSVFSEYVKKLKSVQLKYGIFKNDDSVFIAYKILQKNPRLAKALISKFPYIIIDEAQDTSKNQFLFFDKLVELGLANIEIIGDYYQSIYEWRDARPDKFLEIDQRSDWQSLSLKKCRRSVQPIIDTYSLIRVADERNIISAQEKKLFKIPVHVVVYDPNKIFELVDFYSKLVGESLDKQVLVRGNTLLNQLTGKSTDLPPWKSDVPLKLIEIRTLQKTGKIKRSINKMRNIYVLLLHPDASFKERRLLEKDLKSDYQLNADFLFFIKNMPAFNETLLDWTNLTEIYLKEFLGMSEIVPFDLKRNWKKKYSVPLDELMAQLKKPDRIFAASTIHSAKGMSLDTVLLILNKNSSGTNISINDLNQTSEMPTEKQRLLYVAMSRAKHLLVIGVPNDKKTLDEIKEVFGSQAEYHVKY